MQDNKHDLKALMLDAAIGFYRTQRYRVGDFFGPVDLGTHLAFKHNALTIGALAFGFWYWTVRVQMMDEAAARGEAVSDNEGKPIVPSTRTG